MDKMRMFFGKILFGFMIFSLLSCANQQNTEELHSISQCQTNCRELYELCKTQCLNHCAHCTEVADESAADRYEQYVQEQEVQGGTIARELNSYIDPLQCRKITCNCSADFTICDQGCTGVIQKQLRAKPYCT
jgi:hypothetical protein